MPAIDSLIQILYASRMTGTDVSSMRTIVTASRRSNPQRGITGALLFDGECFAQLLEGPRTEVLDLMERIEADPRHEDLTILFGGPCAAGRSMPAWRSGYCEPQLLESFLLEEGLRGPAALSAFISVLSDADVD
jgi:hypothetical protein